MKCKYFKKYSVLGPSLMVYARRMILQKYVGNCALSLLPRSSAISTLEQRVRRIFIVIIVVITKDMSGGGWTDKTVVH